MKNIVQTLLPRYFLQEAKRNKKERIQEIMKEKSEDFDELINKLKGKVKLSRNRRKKFQLLNHIIGAEIKHLQNLVKQIIPERNKDNF